MSKTPKDQGWKHSGISAAIERAVDSPVVSALSGLDKKLGEEKVEWRFLSRLNRESLTPRQPIDSLKDTMAGEGKAAIKGSLGCLVTFGILAVIAVVAGGHAYMDAGGLLLLLVIGAVIGLIANWIYQKGKCDGES